MAEKTALRFTIGDWVVHYYHGVGKVIDIVERVLEGVQETFFKISASNIEYWLPVDQANAVHIEPIRSEKDFDHALEIITEAPTPMLQPYNQTKRLIYERWLDGSLPSRAALMRDLHGRNHAKELSYDEKELFEKIENFFISEWVITKPSLTKATAKQRLNEALEKSLKKTIPSVHSSV